MTKKNGNIYKTNRQHTGYTQEQASQKLNVAVRTLSDYENGHAPVPDDIAAKMAEIYRAPRLAYQHMKRTSAIAYLIGNNTKGNAIILDTFGGSGSTLIACEQMNRICYMMELDPRYCDVIVRRYYNSFPEVVIKRNGVEINSKNLFEKR